MEKYVDLLRLIIIKFDINNHKFDDIIKNILNKLFDEYYINGICNNLIKKFS